MGRQREVLAKLRARLEELGQRIEELIPDIDDKRLEDLRAEARVVRDKLQAAFAQGAEITEETLRSLGRSIERLADRLQQARSKR
jgi:BMFP domain-containing protein YqiC